MPQTRLLTSEELENLDKSKGFIRVKLDFSSELDLSKTLSHAEYAEKIKSIYPKYENGVLGDLLKVMIEVSTLKADQYPLEMINPQDEFEVYTCGSCGCAPHYLCGASLGGCTPCRYVPPRPVPRGPFES